MFWKIFVHLLANNGRSGLEKEQGGSACAVFREAFPALISPPSRYCNWGFRSAGCVAAAEAEIASKDTPRNACQGQELSSREVLKSFPAERMRLGNASVPKEKLFGKCIHTFSAGFLGTVVSPSPWGLRAGVRESCVWLSCCGGARAPFPCFPVPC